MFKKVWNMNFKRNYKSFPFPHSHSHISLDAIGTLRKLTTCRLKIWIECTPHTPLPIRNMPKSRRYVKYYNIKVNGPENYNFSNAIYFFGYFFLGEYFLRRLFIFRSSHNRSFALYAGNDVCTTRYRRIDIITFFRHHFWRETFSKSLSHARPHSDY